MLLKKLGRARIIDYRVRIGTKAFFKQPVRSQWLMTWRRSHMFGGHPPVRRYARRQGLKPSSKLNRDQLLTFIRRRDLSPTRP